MLTSKRLEALRLCYKNELSVWDIGCDHGLLGSSFAEVDQVKYIHLVDPSVAVVTQLKYLIDSYITKEVFKITLHHKKGQEVKLDLHSNCIFIAGMGGKEIGLISLHLSEQMDLHSRLIISPHRNILELRSQLHASELRLENEFLVEEATRIYQVLILKKLPSLPPVSLYGDKIWQGKWGEEYRIHQLAHFQEHRDEMALGYCRFLSKL